jgi:enoyl-CoA hydratase/carnithine racemase
MLDAPRLEALTRDIRSATADGQVRVLELRGAPGVFCRGMDLTAAVAPEGGLAAMARCLHALRGSGKVTLAVVDGEALGGGLGLAAACDYVLATERATFGLPELLLGLVPATIFPVLLERMPPQRVRRLALLGHAHNADEASALGLVDEVIASHPESFERTVRRVLRRLSRVDASAVALLKGLSTRDDPDRAIEHGAALTDALLATPGVQAKLRNALTGDEATWL